MSNVMSHRPAGFGSRSQRGMTTLLVTLSVLIILTIIILASSNVALFEQKTATNENRAHLAEQSAEYALNLGGEYLKTNVSKISTNQPGGWLDSATAANVRWQSCAAFTNAVRDAASALDQTHPCYSERNEERRIQLYYYTNDGSPHTAGGNAGLDLFNKVPVVLTNQANDQAAAAKLSTAGGSVFPATATVYALLCRVDATPGLSQNNRCRLQPLVGRTIAVTLIAQSGLTGENSSAVVKESWGTVIKKSFAASTPLVASGTVKIIGNFTIVTAPNAGGYGIPASVWSPGATDGGGSWQSCFVEDYLDGLAPAKLTTNPGCADAHTCSCDTEILSKKGAADGVDILDRDGDLGANPDITFFPGGDGIGGAGTHAYGGTRWDHRRVSGACLSTQPYCDTDDNLFEWIFGIDVTGGDNRAVLQNCVVPAAFGGGTDCELQALSDLNFAPVANCNGLNASSQGLIYVTGACSMPNVSQIGTPSHPVILVINNTFDFGVHVDDFFGMIFVRNEENNADVTGGGHGKVFGSLVVEGTCQHMNGTMDIVYMDTSAGNPNDPLPDSTRFARLPGSWLDNTNGF